MSSMENLIPVVNKLQDVFSAIEQRPLDLPLIAVVGSQSSGKSSVVESIVGRDLLPRGAGIVTRRPLVLQLYNTSVGEFEGVSGDAEWGEFLHLPGQRFSDFNLIREEIIRETDRVTGTNKGISNKSINLKIYSPHVLNLTLVDLPGTTKVPVGDQPKDIEAQILAMCMEFISNPNAIILAVSAANQDLANSDGLKMAQAVDRDGERTLCVLTKVDIMDRGTDVVDILSNKVIPLRRGYVAVVNRSQADIQQRVTVREGLRREDQYFLTHPSYKGIIGRCGTSNLAKILNQMLMKHVKDVLPEIKAKISDMIIETDSNLAALGEGLESLTGDRLGAHLLQLLSKFSTQFVNILEVRSNMTAVNITEVFGGARITYIFKEVFGKKLTGIPALEGIADDDIRTTIANSNGLRPAMMMHELAFDLIVRKQIKRLEAPCLQCVELVFDEMLRMTEQSTSDEIKRFPVLSDRMREVVYSHLRRLLPPAQTMISNLIQVELGYLNTSHPDFVNGKQAIAEANRRIAAAAAIPPSGAEISRSEAPLSPPVPPSAPASSSTSSAGQSSATPVKPIAGFTQMFTAGWQTPAAAISYVAPSVAAASSSSALPSSHSAAKAGGNVSNALAPVKLSSVPEVIRISGTPTDRERLETEVIKILVESYFDVVKKNVVDLAPKVIMHFLVNSFRNTVQNQLVSELYGDVPACRELLRENDDVAEERARFNQIKAMLIKAMDIVNEVRDYNAFSPQG